MSLLAHLARATLAPEEALRPALPQAFANWGTGAPAEDEGWSEVASAEAARPGPAPVAVYDDPFAAPDRAPAPAPAPREGHKPAPPRPVLAELPEVEPAPPPQPARSGRGVEPAAEAERQAPAPQPRAVDPRPEPLAEAPAPRRRSHAQAPSEPTAPPVVRVEPLPPVSVPARPIAPPFAEPASPHAVAPEIVAAPVQVPDRPARHDPPAPHRTDAVAPAPEPRRMPPRLEEPRVLREVTRERMTPAGAGAAAPLTAPAVAPAVIAAPVLAAPQIIAPEASEAAPRLPDVHISIGRVEVRAAAAPPRPAPREAPGAKAAPLSLDAYLNRRSGGGR